MKETRIKSTPGGAGDTSHAKPSNDKFRNNSDKIDWSNRPKGDKK